MFEVAKLYCGSEDAKARARGLSVLAQLDAGKPDGERPFMADCVSIAIEHIRESDEEIVRCAVPYCFPHARQPLGHACFPAMSGQFQCDDDAAWRCSPYCAWRLDGGVLTVDLDRLIDLPVAPP